MSRAAPEPTIGFPALTSGVPLAPPKPEGVDGSFCPPLLPDEAPYGLAKMGWLNRLKNSARNWSPNRSWNLKFLNIEKSTFRKPESRKMFRPIVPKVPALGGTMTDLPETKQ